MLKSKTPDKPIQHFAIFLVSKALESIKLGLIIIKRLKYGLKDQYVVDWKKVNKYIDGKVMNTHTITYHSPKPF